MNINNYICTNKNIKTMPEYKLLKTTKKTNSDLIRINKKKKDIREGDIVRLFMYKHKRPIDFNYEKELRIYEENIETWSTFYYKLNHDVTGMFSYKTTFNMFEIVSLDDKHIEIDTCGASYDNEDIKMKGDIYIHLKPSFTEKYLTQENRNSKLEMHLLKINDSQYYFNLTLTVTIDNIFYQSRFKSIPFDGCTYVNNSYWTERRIAL